MDAKDIIKVGRKAKSETEVFINRYLNDRAKGWPKLCFCDSLYAESRLKQQQRGHGGY